MNAVPVNTVPMDTVFVIVLAMLSVAGASTLVRMIRGPDTLDRIVALDGLVVLIVAGAAVYVASQEDGSYIPLLAVVALLGFTGSVTAARLAERERRERHR